MNMQNRFDPKNFAEWQDVQAIDLDNGLYYSRFCLSNLTIEECQLIQNALQQALLTDEILCARFTHAKIQNAPNNLMSIVGIEESIPEILQNFSQIELWGTSQDLASHCPFLAILDLSGPTTATAGDIELPPGIDIVDESHHIATITEPIPFFVELRIELESGDCKGETPVPDEEGYSIDATFTAFKKVDTSIQSYEYAGETFHTLFIYIWTDSKIEPDEVLWQASRKIDELFYRSLESNTAS